ncbi:MAG: efflux RND transporter permease subunit, partial [Synergistaceae bacterium]|nr:efflux RND transporter permease subunit [Synergistaceae bacterium]
MSGFIRFCIKNPVFVWCVVIMLAVLGVFNYAKLGVTLYPDISPATVLVRTAYEGASPEEVERLVTEPLEDALADLSGLKSMTSYSQDGVSLLGLELDEGLDIDLKIIDVENKISGARGGLPDDASEPVTMKMSLSEEPFLIASFTSDLPETEAKRTVDEEIKPRISRIEGVSQVLVSGGLDREIQIALDPLALQEHGISYDDVFACVARNNTAEPSGYVTREADRVSLRMAGEFGGVDEIRKVMIPAAGGHPIPLELLGDVVDGARDRESIARAGGGRVIQLQVSGRVNADLVKAGEAVKSEISRLVGGMPGFTVSYTLDDTGFVQKSVKNVIRDTIAGIALTSLVIYLFMGRLSAALIVASVMPIAFVSVFSPMRMHGYSLNLITALALALSMGVLVDNAILLIENIYRCRDMGCGPFEAAERGAAEISVSVMAGTLTNIGVFLPVAMLSGLPGQTLAPYAVTIFYSTLIALWVTLSVIPMMAARMLGGASGMPRSGRVLTGWWNWLFDGFQDLFMLLM